MPLQEGPYKGLKGLSRPFYRSEHDTVRSLLRPTKVDLCDPRCTFAVSVNQASTHLGRVGTGVDMLEGDLSDPCRSTFVVSMNQGSTGLGQVGRGLGMLESNLCDSCRTFVA